MNTALEALSLSSAGRADEAIKLIAAAENSMPNEYLETLHAIVAKNSSTADALNSFTSALIAAREPTVSNSFGFVEDEPLDQMVALYLKLNRPRAALKLAERVAAFHGDNNTVLPTEDAVVRSDTFERYQTLRDRAEQRKRTTRFNLLAMLSTAAEQLGELNRAVELERLRLALVNTSAERNATQARLDHLQQLQSSANRVRKTSFVVDQKLVASE